MFAAIAADPQVHFDPAVVVAVALVVRIWIVAKPCGFVTLLVPELFVTPTIAPVTEYRVNLYSWPMS